MYEERVLVVTLGGEQENVVRAFEVVERMSLPVFAQSHRAFAVCPFRHETPAFLLSREALPLRLEAGVELREALPEILQTALEEVFGEK